MECFCSVLVDIVGEMFEMGVWNWYIGFSNVGDMGILDMEECLSGVWDLCRWKFLGWDLLVNGIWVLCEFWFFRFR